MFRREREGSDTRRTDINERPQQSQEMRDLEEGERESISRMKERVVQALVIPIPDFTISEAKQFEAMTK